MRNGKIEEYGLITAGDDINIAATFLAPGRTEYSAAEVVAQLLSGLDAPAGTAKAEAVCYA